MLFIGAYKIELSTVSLSTKEKAVFILLKNNNKILIIKAILRNPKTPPKILLTSPKAAKSANFVNSFPKEAITITIAIKVIAKAVKEI